MCGRPNITRAMRGNCRLFDFQPKLSGKNPEENIRMLGTCLQLLAKPAPRRSESAIEVKSPNSLGRAKRGCESVPEASRIQTDVLDFGRLDLVFLNLLIKGTSRDSETLRGFLHSASLFLKHSLDVLFFEFQEGET